MALLHFSASICPTSNYFSASASSPLPSAARRNLIISCFSRKEGVSKREKPPRSTKSIEDLCNDIRDFMSMAGLPEDSVPTLRELSQHGRKDLANRVRRRGYKLIAEHLLKLDKCNSFVEGYSQSVTNTMEVGINVEGISLMNCDPSDSCQDDLIENWHNGSTECVQNVPESDDDAMVRENSANVVAPTSISSHGYNSVEPSSSLSLREMAANFVYNGELDALDGTMEVPEIHIVDPGVLARTDDSQIGNYPEIDEVVSSGQINGYSKFSDDEVGSNFMTTEQESSRMNQIEIDRLKEMLRQKELELSQLKQQIGSEKHALSILQSKAKSEIGNAQKIISEKDAELHAAEESLSGLREVIIVYHGMGETVEVGGSFNGWHHTIKMDPSSETVDSTGSRAAMLWSTVLWLYPGVYEIKFIVDGHWKIDSTKECTSRGHIQNNILRVDR